jgi:hypothetical protein
MNDQEDDGDAPVLIDSIDNAPFPQAIAETASQWPLQAFDVRMLIRIVAKLLKTAVHFLNQGPVGLLIGTLRLVRQK